MRAMGRTWRRAVSLDDLEGAGRLVFRTGAKQIAIFGTEHGVFACDNRCPHEGYPLSEGLLNRSCELTCQWHNWKFDLRSGENLLGGDHLRVYPVSVRDGEVWVDVADPPFEDLCIETLRHLSEAFEDADYQRLAREFARLQRLGADPVEALREAIVTSHGRLQFGWTHAHAGAADWLSLHDERADDQEARLVCVLESTAHIAHDVLREPEFPYPPGAVPYDEDGFVQAIEAEDEPSAVAMVRGALRDGLSFQHLERGLTRAALAHYSDFGHSLIYVSKAGRLIERLGSRSTEPLLVSLVRSLVYATREDEIPEFRPYRAALARWGSSGRREPRAGAAPDMHAWRGLGLDAALERTLDWDAAAPGRLYAALLGANADNLLRFDARRQAKVRMPVSENVGWLDFTHGITFASAVRLQCTRFPELWPQGLLQMACFSGRNARYTDPRLELEAWRVDAVDDFMEESVEQLFDHGCGEYIVSVHLLKTVLAVREELRAGLPEDVATTLAAALNRFLASPLKRKHVRRTVYQAMTFVSRDG